MVLKNKKLTSKKKKIVKKRPTTKRRPAVIAKKKLVRKPLRRKEVIKETEGKVVGVVTHYFPKVRAAVVKLNTNLSIGDTIKIKGHTTDFTQNVTSIQINRIPINSAKKGQEIGLLVNSRVRKKDIVYKI